MSDTTHSDTSTLCISFMGASFSVVGLPLTYTITLLYHFRQSKAMAANVHCVLHIQWMVIESASATNWGKKKIKIAFILMTGNKMSSKSSRSFCVWVVSCCLQMLSVINTSPLFDLMMFNVSPSVGQKTNRESTCDAPFEFLCWAHTQWEEQWPKLVSHTCRTNNSYLSSLTPWLQVKHWTLQQHDRTDWLIDFFF